MDGKESGEALLQPERNEIEHECPDCGCQFYQDCIHGLEKKLIAYVKAWILFVAGNAFVCIIFGAFSLHSWALYNGKTGIGININYLLTTCVAAIAGVILWAFPKRK